MNYLNAARGFIAANPKQIALSVGGAAIVLVPGAVTGPFFAVLGFTPAGPAAGSVASAVMSYCGVVPTGGVYATIQSAAMGGSGAAVAAGVTQAGAALTSAAGWAFGRIK